MTQAQLALELPQHSLEPGAADHGAFAIGWDHAQHGLVPPAALLEGSPVGAGWLAGRAVFGRRTLAAPRPVRQWLQLRTQAWQRGIAFHGAQVTPQFLAQIEVTHCPVTRRPLGGTEGDAPVVQRLHPGVGYAAGVLAVVSRQVADAGPGLAALRLPPATCVDAAAATKAARAGVLPPDQAWRLAVLHSLVEPLPFAVAVRMPLRALPPPRVRLANPSQRLQTLLTLQFATPGWSERLRAVADALPSRDLRLDFNLFVGALAPRVLDAGTGLPPRALRHALEDAWADARLNRRWQTFVSVLGEHGTRALLARVAGTTPGR